MITIHIEIEEKTDPVPHVAVRHKGHYDGHPSEDEKRMGNLIREAINDTLSREASNSGKWHRADIIRRDLTKEDKL